MQVTPKLGNWYHLINKNSQSDNRIYCLCVNIHHTDEMLVSLYIHKRNRMTELCHVYREELKEAVWRGTNRFHKFCLQKIEEILGQEPSLDDLNDNILFKLCFESATDFRIIQAKDEFAAIDRAYFNHEKVQEDSSLSPDYRKELARVFNLLVNEYQSLKHFLP